MNIQATYRKNIFTSVEDMDKAVDNHIYYNANELPKNYRAILRMLSRYSVTTKGTSHLKYESIAEVIGCSKATVTRAIKRLKELGIIEVTKGTKKNGIQGADYFSILNFSHVDEMRTRTLEVQARDTHETPRSSKVEHVKHEQESFNSFKTSFNPFVSSVNNNVKACAHDNDLKQSLRAIYNPSSVEDNQAFEELCKIAFGRLKQYLNSHSVPYLQLEQIVLKAMHDLVRKQNVKNQFAMYSAMIKRQVEQLFEQHIKPKQSVNTFGKKVGVVPDWFEKHNQDMIDRENERSLKQKAEWENMSPAELDERRQDLLARLGVN